jgi:hypothetical protein
MITQPEALRLADELDADSNIIGYDKHAAELRRLHAEVEELRGALDEAMWHVKYKELKAVNEELLVALHVLLNNNECLTGEPCARAAIAKAGGEA